MSAWTETKIIWWGEKVEIKITIHAKRNELTEDIYIHINYKQQNNINLVLFCYCAYALCI